MKYLIFISLFIPASFQCSSGNPQNQHPQNNVNNLNNYNNLNNINNINNIAPDIIEPVDVPEDTTDLADADVVAPDVPWWEGPDSTGVQPFHFLVISDTHLRIPGYPDDADYNNQKNIDNLIEAVGNINNHLAHARFVAVTGDLVGALFSSDPADYPEDADTPAHRFRTIMSDLTMPWQVVLGNHDYQENYTNEGITADDPADMEAVWQRVLGIPPYYSIVFRGQRFLFLNSVRGDRYWDACFMRTEEASCTGSFDVAQLVWIEQMLNQPEPVYMFFHNPLRTDSWYTLWSAVGSSFQVHADDHFYTLAQAYANRIRAIFVGHGHLWASDTLNDTIAVYETNAIGDGMGNPRNIHIVYVDPAQDTFTVTRY